MPIGGREQPFLNWLKRRRPGDGIPEYAAIRRTPSRGLPPDLADREASEAFTAQREVIERSLREPPRRPQEQSPLFVELLAASEGGVMTITLPGRDSRCLPIFTSPFRAADYIRTLLARGPAVTYLSSSPLELVRMLQDVRPAGIETFALDRCPRCNSFTTISCASIATADDAIRCWSIWKASQLARLDLYLGYAQASARAGKLEAARDVVLETIAHVSFEDRRAHLLIGQIAVALHDRPMLREAKAFLRFFRLDSWERRLDEVAGSGGLDLEFTTE